MYLRRRDDNGTRVYMIRRLNGEETLSIREIVHMEKSVRLPCSFLLKSMYLRLLYVPLSSLLQRCSSSE